MPRPLNLVDVIQGLNSGITQALAPTADVQQSALLSQVALAADTLVMTDTVTLTVGSPHTWDDGSYWGLGCWV